MEPLTNPFVPPQIAPAPKWGPSVYAGAGLAGLAQGLAQGMKAGEEFAMMRRKDAIDEARQQNQATYMNALLQPRVDALKSKAAENTAMANAIPQLDKDKAAYYNALAGLNTKRGLWGSPNSLSLPGINTNPIYVPTAPNPANALLGK